MIRIFLDAKQTKHVDLDITAAAAAEALAWHALKSKRMAGVADLTDAEAKARFEIYRKANASVTQLAKAIEEYEKALAEAAKAALEAQQKKVA